MSGELAELDIYRLAEMWAHGQIDAETYFAEVEKRAAVAIDDELRMARLVREARRP